MHDALTGLAERADRWIDAALAAVILAVGVGELLFATPRGTALALGIAAVELFGVAAVALRRRWPLALALAFSAMYFIPGVVIGARWINAPSDSLLLSLLVLAYTTGASLDRVPATVGLVALCVGSSGGDFSDPVVLVVFTVPAWVAGTAMRSRARLTTQLAERAQELEREREAFAREAVRYERVRIARDLHDVVAHNLSMIVVQAAAGRRTLAADPTVAAESLRHIEDGAAQAELEIAQLVHLLAGEHPVAGQGGLRALDELVRRAAASGLAVRYAFTGDDAEVPPALARAALHVTQEGITNALKHAPGAAIDVTVHAGNVLVVTVENGPPREAASDLSDIGGTHGIAGLHDRVIAHGGELSSGPTPDGGWRITAELPRD